MIEGIVGLFLIILFVVLAFAVFAIRRGIEALRATNEAILAEIVCIRKDADNQAILVELRRLIAKKELDEKLRGVAQD